MLTPTDSYKMALKQAISQIKREDIEAFAARIMKVKGIVYIVGNGGSNATASHFAEDLVKAAGIRAIAIDSAPLITASGNDNGYLYSFSTSLCTLMGNDDLVFAISGSGNSENIIQSAFRSKLFIALLGFDGGRVGNLFECDDKIIVQSDDMQIIEDVHLAICHMIVRQIMEEKNSG